MLIENLLDFIGYESTWSWWMGAYFSIGLVIGALSALAAFAGLWIWASAEKRFWGFLLGWLPSAIAAIFIGLVLIPLWGLVALAYLYSGGR